MRSVSGFAMPITHNSGTSTLHSCLAAAGVGPGDEVISPALTVISNAAVTLHQNAVPVFADIDPDTFNMDPEDVERRITPRTKAIMPVHLYGLPCDMDPIMALAEKHHLIVIEDAAQCFLGQYKGRLAGTIGHMGSFSFENTKHMSTGDGGIVITNDERLAEAVRKFACVGYSMVTAASGQVRTKAFAFQDPNFKRHTGFGWQYRLPEVAAAIGMAQVARLNEYVAKRQADLGPLRRCGQGLLLPQAATDAAGHSERLLDLCRSLRRGSRPSACRGTISPPSSASLAAKASTPPGRWSIWNRSWPNSSSTECCPTHCPLYDGKVEWHKGLCPTAEAVQPKIMQFKGNIGNLDEARQQADALRRTIEFFG